MSQEDLLQSFRNHPDYRSVNVLYAYRTDTVYITHDGTKLHMLVNDEVVCLTGPDWNKVTQKGMKFLLTEARRFRNHNLEIRGLDKEAT